MINSALGIRPTANPAVFLRGLSKPADFQRLVPLLRNRLVPDADVEALRMVYAGHHDELQPLVRGALQFFFFMRAAERFSRTGDQNQKIVADEHLKGSDATEFVMAFYVIPPEYRSRAISLHRVGTTSYILKLGPNHVLKLIKPWYHENSTIAEATRSYKDNYGTISAGPEIHASAPKFIVMDFVDGKTVREYIDDYLRANAPNELGPRDKLAAVAQAVDRVCSTLGAYADATKKPHMDLSPHNIILRCDDDHRVHDAVLIDFGYNYLLLERVGSASALARAQSYIAPELQEGDLDKSSMMSDVYSLGMILLDMLVREARGSSGRGEKEGGDLDPQHRADHMSMVWRAFPQLARGIESMVEANPEHRLFGHERGPSLYEVISTQVKADVALWDHVYESVPPEDLELIEVGRAVAFRQFQLVSQAYKNFRALRVQQRRHAGAKRLFWWSLVAQLAQGIVVAAFALFSLADIGWRPLPELLSRVDLFDVLSRDSIDNLPGRIVGLSFGLLATRYYMNIFLTLSARGVSSNAEFWMRLNAFCYAFPILWAIVLEPHDWPFCSAVGVLLVAANNYANLTIARVSLADAKHHGNSFAHGEDLVREYKSWWELMFLYGLGLAAVGFLLDAGFAHDEIIYAIIVALIVNGMMYHYNCSENAPEIRSGLERLLSERRRRIWRELRRPDPGWTADIE